MRFYNSKLSEEANQKTYPPNVTPVEIIAVTVTQTRGTTIPIITVDAPSAVSENSIRKKLVLKGKDTFSFTALSLAKFQ